MALSLALQATETTFVVDDSAAYNAWPQIRVLDGRLLVVYEHTRGHEYTTGKVGCSLARLSSDCARTWSEPVDTAWTMPDAWGALSDVPAGKGDALFWHRYWKHADRWHGLYRTTDGVRFEPLSRPRLDPMPVQVMAPVDVPGRGLVSLWFAGSYDRQEGHSWGLVVSTDGGRTWTQQVVERDLLKRDWPTEQSLVHLGGSRLLALARAEQRCEGNPVRRLFSLVSEDLGRTWRRELTNIDDVLESTPSLLHDRATDELVVYYFQRGPGLLKRRTAKAAEVFACPTGWSEPRIVACGRKLRDWDSGNVNAVRLDGSDYLAYYAGNERVSSVLVSVVGKAESPATSWSGRRVLFVGDWRPDELRAEARKHGFEPRLYPDAMSALADHPREAFAHVVFRNVVHLDRDAVLKAFPNARIHFADSISDFRRILERRTK